MLIFEIIKTNTPPPQKGLAPILIDIYVAYATQATISSVKHKEPFHQNYLEKYVPRTYFPPDRLLSVFSGVFFLCPREYESRGWNDASPVILQTAAYLITSVSSPQLLQSYSLYLQTKYIKHHCPFHFHLNILIAAEM